MIFAAEDDNVIYLSRTDANSVLSSYADKPFFLDDCTWPTVAHYFHAMKFNDEQYRQRICQAASPETAQKLGRNRLKRIRKDWKKVRITMMTRAVYTCCRTHAEVANALLETGNKMIIENAVYDYFWGCGRDRRGENQYGKVLMNVRNKLLEESKKV